MNSKIYVGQVSHTRTAPVTHSFTYPIYYYAFDLAELPALEQVSPLFGYNRWRPVSLHDADYFGREEDVSLQAKVTRFVQQYAPGAEQIDKIELVTSARYFNHVFNPVSFFFCYDAAGSLKFVVAHVNNTFNETHLYLLHNPLNPGATGFTRYRIDKDFHVSPFFDREGRYDFHFKPLNDKLEIRIALEKENETVFTAQLRGQAQPFSHASLLQTLGRYPLTASLTMPRILWEAAKLYFLRRLPVYKKPMATSQFTVRKSPSLSWLQKWSMKLLFALGNKMEEGCLEITLPDQSRRLMGNPQAAERQQLTVHDYQFFPRVLLAGDIGLGESYMAGEWEAEDLPGLLSLLIKNISRLEQLERRLKPLTALKTVFHSVLRWRRKNSVNGSRKNIQAHYDLSNKLYRHFLDETMTYSAAVFERPEQSLAEAQGHKLRLMIQKARIEPHHHVLEIGSGWGSFALEAVRQTGCRVTSITISEEQYRLAQQRVEAAGLADKIDIQLKDYRHLEGQFDRIVSIEMLEAVGHEYLPEFFQNCDRLLKPNGIMALQTITIPDQRYDQYRRGFDWIRKYIFPGGHLPSLQVLATVLTDHTRLIIEDVENIGPHYALTLARWRERFLRAEAQIRQTGFDDEFCRKWLFYFGYCEAGFATRHINNLQLVLTRAHNPALGLWR